METKGEEMYYRGRDLMNINKRILFQRIHEELTKQGGDIAVILSQKEKNNENLTRYRREIEDLRGHQTKETQIKRRETTYSTIGRIQGLIVQILQPVFHDVFTKIADDPNLGGLAYNEELRTDVWLDIIFGYQDISGASEGSRENYRYESRMREKQAKDDLKKIEKKEKKIWIPRDHSLLNEKSYLTFQQTMWTHLDNIVDTYQQKFLNDSKEVKHLQGLIDHYFLFIFIQMLTQSKLILDIKSRKTTHLFQQIIDDTLSHLKEKYSVSPSISFSTIKKKFFSSTDKIATPLELSYKNCTEEDLVAREIYLNTYFFNSKKTSVDLLRRKIMVERHHNIEKMDRSLELMNPAYHAAKQKKEVITKSLDILEHHRENNPFVESLIHELQDRLKYRETDMTNTVVFEEDPVIAKDPDSLIKIEQQYLTYYQVPIQYRKIFGVVINRLNNFHQIKTILKKKAKKTNDELFQRLIHSDQGFDDIMYHLNGLITKQHISSLFNEKRENKQSKKTERIQSFAMGTAKLLPSLPKKQTPQGQIVLEF